MCLTATEGGFYIKGKDGKDVFVYCWDDVDAARAVVQIFHGMAEHAGRYERLARFLNTKGIIVYANDHRGHGRTAGSPDEVGCIGKDGFNNIIEDEFIITGRVKENHPDLPVVVIGHSFGSFIAQDFITRYGGDIAGVIFSGSAMIPEADVKPGIIIASIQKAFLGERKKSNFFHKLSFSNYNKKFADEHKEFAWLSRDQEEVKKYVDDPYCGAVFSIGFYYYFFKGLAKLHKPDKVSKIPKELPVFIISGSEDPVGGYGANVEKLYKMYKDLGMKDLEIKLYPGARHEVFNEINRDEVFNDVANWISTRILEK
ncbi:MAG: alpha/beta hydrolase [Peptococcaceae bacterium]|nr:alpha/beta hydrolase [Peptococcaceae bacterium]